MTENNESMHLSYSELVALLNEQAARIAELEAQLGEAWQPVPADSLIVWGLREMIMANGLEGYNDCTVCRRAHDGAKEE